MSLIVLARFDSVGEAEIARSALDAAGIGVEIADENLVRVNWLMSNALGGVKLLVREEDRELAAAVIASEAAPADAEEDLMPASAPAQPQCPVCGSTNIRRIPRLRIFSLIAVAIAAVGYVFDAPEMTLAALAAAVAISLVAPTAYCGACRERLHLEFVEEEARNVPVPPDPKDTVEELCPRCGSPDFFRISYRKFKAIPMFFHAAIVVAVPILLFLPKRQCDRCGLKA